MNFDFLKDCVGKVGVELTRENCESLSRYYEMVVEKNKAFNLTAITEEKDFAIKHIADSLAGISEIPQNAVLLDIGAEKPHCGIEARKLPINGPNFCEFSDKFSIFSEK